MNNAYHETDETLIDAQLRLESEMTKKGIDAYVKTVMEAKTRGTEDTLAASVTLMQHHTAKLEAAITAWLAEMASGTAGRRGVAHKYLKATEPGVLAYITLKRLLGRVSIPVMIQSAAREVGTAIEDEMRLQLVREEERKTYESILRGAKKRSSDHYKRVYAMRRASEATEWLNWPEDDRMHTGMKLIDLAIEALGWFSIETRTVGKNNTQKLLVASPELLVQMEEHHGMTALLRPMYEPMVVPPRDWTNPRDGGYLSSNVQPVKLVKINNAAYYEELQNTDMPVVYSAVNALQRTAWRINKPLLAVLQEFWQLGNAVAKLPTRLDLDIPPTPHDIDTNDEARLEWRKRAAKTHQENTQERSKRVAVNTSVTVAGRYAEFERIYMPYQLDFRGRIYAVPSFNPQGPDYMKALLQFADAEPLGETGAQWLAMHGANVAGNDKCTLEERVQWVLDNEDEIVRCGRDPFEHRGWYDGIAGQKIDKPWQFLAFCQEWAGYVEQGDAFVSRIAIALDGSCSGLQHFSAMLRDEIGGAAVNLTPSDTPRDVYGLVAGKVNEALHAILASTDLPEGDLSKLYAQQWLDFEVTRKVTKRPVMTLAYGSKQFGFKGQLMVDVLEPAYKAAQNLSGEVDRSVFPFEADGYKAASFMAKMIWEAVTATLVKSVEAMTWLQQAASIVAAEDLPIRWASPVGFPVMQAYWDISERRIHTSLQGKLIKVTMGTETDKMDKKAQANGISPNLVHSADAAHMMLTTVRAEQEGITSFAMIHDSFGTTAAGTEKLFRIVRESFVEMYEEVDVLAQFEGEIRRQLSAEQLLELPPLPERGTLDLQGVIASRFCFA